MFESSACQCCCQRSIIDRELAVDGKVANAGRQNGGLLVGGALVEGLGIEGEDIGEVTGLQQTAIF